MTNVLKISSHDELISSTPHTLGFTPARLTLALSRPYRCRA
jgi:hypothetical protein